MSMGAADHQSDPKVTLILPATSVEKALRSLSNATQVPLAASPQTANDIITLRYKDVPLSQAMERLAEAVDGTWKQEKGILRLIRTSEQQKSEETKEFQQDVLHIRKSIQKRIDAEKSQPAWSPTQADTLAAQVAFLLKQFDPQKSNSDWYKKSARLGEQAPIGRIITKVLAALDPELIASTNSFYKTVFSTNPTSLQRPMPPEVGPVIEEFIQEQKDWIAALERYQVANPVFNGATYSVGDFGVLPTAGAPPSSVATVLLTIQNWGALTGFNVEFSAYDAKGKKVERAQVNIGNVYADIETESKGSDDAEDQMIYYEGDAKTFYESQLQSARSWIKPLPSDLLAKVVDAQDFDPLSFMVSPSLQRVAEVRGWNMVANLSDSMLAIGFMQGSNGVRVSQFLKRLKYCQEDWTVKDGWLVVKPMRPSESRRNRANRHELAGYLRVRSESKRINLEQQAYFSLRLPEQHLNGLPDTMARIVSSEAQPDQDELTLRLFGLLTKDQIARMEAGGLSMRSLTERQNEIVSRMVYGPNAFLQYQAAQNRSGIARQDSEEFVLYQDGILKESTVSIPNGLPADGVITLNETAAIVVTCSPENSGTSMLVNQTFEAEPLAWQKYSQEHSNFLPAQEDHSVKLDFNRLRRGEQSNLNFKFLFSPVLSLSRTLQGLTFPDSISVTLADLPEDFQMRFNKAYAMYQKAYASVRPTQFIGSIGSASPPPKL